MFTISRAYRNNELAAGHERDFAVVVVAEWPVGIFVNLMCAAEYIKMLSWLCYLFNLVSE